MEKKDNDILSAILEKAEKRASEIIETAKKRVNKERPM